MPIPRCSECIVKSEVKTGAAPLWWSVETLVPKFGKEPKTEMHLVRLGKELKNVGRCLTLFEAETACGLTFKTEVDSSD